MKKKQKKKTRDSNLKPYESKPNKSPRLYPLRHETMI